MIVVVAGVLLASFLIALRAHKAGKRRKRLADAPLAGYDTGARFARRVPGSRRFRPHRGF